MWNRASETLPDANIVCLVCRRVSDSRVSPKFETHPMTAEWNGEEWIDIEGDSVDNVVFWQELPKVSSVESVKEKIQACLSHDACEITECCYFTRQKELSAMLKYIKELEERQ